MRIHSHEPPWYHLLTDIAGGLDFEGDEVFEFLIEEPTIDTPEIVASMAKIGPSYTRLVKRLLTEAHGVAVFIFDDGVWLVVERNGYYLGVVWTQNTFRSGEAFDPPADAPIRLHEAMMSHGDKQEVIPSRRTMDTIEAFFQASR